MWTISEKMGQGKNDLAVLHLTCQLDFLEFSLLCLSILHPLAFRLKTWTTKMESFGILFFVYNIIPVKKNLRFWQVVNILKEFHSWKTGSREKPEALLNVPPNFPTTMHLNGESEPWPLWWRECRVGPNHPCFTTSNSQTQNRIERSGPDWKDRTSQLSCMLRWLPSPGHRYRQGFNHFNRW